MRRLYLLVLCFVLCGGCHNDRNREIKAVFTPLGIEVSGIPPRTPLTLYDARGGLILSYPPLAGPDVLLVFPWKPKATYCLRAGGKEVWLTAPRDKPLAELSVLAPLGAPEQRFLVFPGEKKKLSFVVSTKEDCPEIGILFTVFDPKLQEVAVQGQTKSKILPVLTKPERCLFRERLCFAGRSPKEIKVELGNTEVTLSFEHKYVDLSGKIRILAWRIPTDESGLALRYRREGLLVLPNPLFEHLGYLLGVKEQGYSRYAPFAYQTLVLENESPVPVNLLVKAHFLDVKTGRQVEGFYPPQFFSSGHMKEPVALTYLPPKGRARVVLPVYAEVPSGEYLARVEIYPLGGREPVLIKERRIGVTRGKPWLAAGLLVIMGSGLLFSLGLLFGHRHLLKRFRTRELCLISLSGAVAFGLDFLGGLLSNILYALLGPFNVLVGGLITEVIHYAVFTAIFVLVPKPGFATLSCLLHYLMGLLLYGGIRATDPFFVGSRILTLEALLLLFAVYRKPISWRTVLALSLADALQTLSSLILHMTFYRLFFPVWYLWLSILVKGFLYTLFGAALGLRLGKHLREMER